MSQIKSSLSDHRKRYTHQAFDVTYLGKSLETGPSGSGKRLSATYQASIRMNIDAGVAGAQTMGDLTEGLFITGVVNHTPLTTGTLQLTLPAHGGEAELTLLTVPLALNAAAVQDTVAAALAPLPIDRPLTATIATGTSGETAVISLLVTPAESGWK